MLEGSKQEHYGVVIIVFTLTGKLDKKRLPNKCMTDILMKRDENNSKKGGRKNYSQENLRNQCL